MVRQVAFISMLLINSFSLNRFTVGDDPERQALLKLGFLVGTWRTESIWPETGEQAPGTLTYEWVLGGTWLKITFVGQHPTRPVWEAHGMIRYLPQKERYESIIFAGPGEPVRMEGYWVSEDVLRFEVETGGVKSGIDYMPGNEGVYQENWAQEPGGPRAVRLKTTYSLVSR